MHSLWGTCGCFGVTLDLEILIYPCKLRGKIKIKP